MKSVYATTGGIPFLKSDPARWGFQYLEDIATGYWYSQVLFSAVELNVFGRIETGCTTPADLAAAAGCKLLELTRLLTVLVRMDLIHITPGGLVNSQLARRFLVPGQPDYMGDFVLYRRYMQAGWSGLTLAVAQPERPADPGVLTADSDYAARNFHYVRAMDRLARLKARDIVAGLNPDAWRGPILDVGGGAGALCRELVRSQSALGRPVTATLFDLPEVIAVVRRLYPQEDDWQGIGVIEGDFRHHDFTEDASFGLVVLSNFLHAYAGETARQLLVKAAALTAPDGVLLIHDYFPDRTGRRPHKGSLYDLNMMLNTFDGGCQPAGTVREWLSAAGLPHIFVQDLESDSTIMLAGRSKRVQAILPAAKRNHSMLDVWPAAARQLGFSQAELIRTDQIRTAAWTREKCRFGCAGYGHNRMCPPDGIDHAAMVKMLAEYRWALLVIATPPGKQFHDQLLALEKKAFLAGLHKALAFGAGPCPVCSRCPVDGSCRHPDLARPSMEGSGIDVYETARQAGIHLEPVIEPGRYVKYVGMVLLI
ncbi:MAG: methyltransferase domain-containing protein [Desulfobacteraceae bacterium]|nr:MAG: methyltransferase domain-containing protein [Desulfobacteraceae bacterium]